MSATDASASTTAVRRAKVRIPALSEPLPGTLSRPLPTLGGVPELPEVQALAERIDAALAGAVLVRAAPLSFSALKTVTPTLEELGGMRLVRAGRRGKFLVFGLRTLTVLL